MKDNLALLKNVGIWIRVSTESQAQSDSPEIHLQRARAYALAKGWNALKIYNLAGVSGKAVMEHSEAKRMMADIKGGHISGLIFSNLSRLSRNLREIQDFGDFFRQNNADLISLNEAIDTSTAGGRMFFNLLGVFAQWYREDITDKIHASFLTRAKLGKLLNSNVPYGYKVVKGQMVQHPDEAPIRREAYELFLQHHRKYTVAEMLNAKGYRTRKNRQWKNTQIADILTDGSAKGVHFFNRIKRTKAWTGTLKPEAEWGRIECEPIVTEELWQQVNQILEAQQKSYKKPGRVPAHPFSRLVWCKCGGRMYARTDSPKYLCRACNNKFPLSDLELVFRNELKAFFASPEKLSTDLAQAEQTLKQREALIASHQQAIQKVRDEMKQTHQLYLEGQITKQGFGDFYKPAEERLNQLVAELPKLQAEIDLLKVNQLSAEDIASEAGTLYDRWPQLTIDDRRKIAEAMCEKITIGPEGKDRAIVLNLSYHPSSEELCKNQTRL
jgi:site-specific DNA recombinase